MCSARADGGARWRERHRGISRRAFPVILLASLGLVMAWGWNVGDTTFDTTAWPVTHLVVGTVFGQRGAILPCVVEILPCGINGRAMTMTIAFAEQNFITRADGERVDHSFFGTAHEVAHSWWGGQVPSAYVRGGAFLSEALSNYSAMMVTEKVLGPEQARRAPRRRRGKREVEREQDEWGAQRGVAGNPTLAREACEMRHLPCWTGILPPREASRLVLHRQRPEPARAFMAACGALSS